MESHRNAINREYTSRNGDASPLVAQSLISSLLSPYLASVVHILEVAISECFSLNFSQK